jgi:flagellar protein FlaF
MSIAAYQQAAKRSESPRESEWRAFQTVTTALLRAQSSGGFALSEALNDNRRLWALLADDCAQPDNQLPQPLRAQIISLALWVNRHSREAARNAALVQDLVDVNRAIMEGLSGRP